MSTLCVIKATFFVAVNVSVVFGDMLILCSSRLHALSELASGNGHGMSSGLFVCSGVCCRISSFVFSSCKSHAHLQVSA